jgi:Cu-Zn family superoxide dismutase
MKQAWIAGAALAVLVSGCASMGAGEPKALAKLEPTKGNLAAGSVEFTERGGKVYVTGTVTGLAPGREHGFHIHEKGDCSSGDGMSAGGHFNPDSKPHGPQGSPHHSGDMVNLTADAAGAATVGAVLDDATIAPGPKSIVGRALIVHKDPDDYRTQPTGNSGARIACGVIAAR